MNAVRKPTEPPAEKTPAAEPPVPASETSRPNHRGSPVHALQARIEAALTGPNEARTIRITGTLLVLALSTWLAAVVLQTGA